MKVTIRKWGNSLGLRLPSAVAKALDIREGTVMDMALEDNALVVRPAREKARNRRPRRFTEQEILATLTPAHFDREEMDAFDQDLPGEFGDYE